MSFFQIRTRFPVDLCILKVSVLILRNLIDSDEFSEIPFFHIFFREMGADYAFFPKLSTFSTRF